MSHAPHRHAETRPDSVLLEQHAHPSELMGGAILGFNDGIVTTLVFALSVAGASNGAYRAVTVAGLAEMLAGGVSMFLGGYTAARATREAYHFQVGVEQREIEQEPDEERAEVTRMYRDKGFRGPLLDAIVYHVTSDPDRWLRVMVRDELGMPPEEGAPPWQAGLAVGLSFVAGALIPIISFFAHLGHPTLVAIALSITALMLTGAGRSRYSHKAWWRSAMEMLAVGLIGAAAGYLIGRGLAALGQ